jgi:uncharacterized protein (DUF1697 family)
MPTRKQEPELEPEQEQAAAAPKEGAKKTARGNTASSAASPSAAAAASATVTTTKETTAAAPAVYVAFLRGINVGGVIVKMDRLTKLFEELGFGSVTTILATGNVIFSSDNSSSGSSTPGEIQELLEGTLSERFGYTAYVQVYTLRAFAALVAAYALPRSDTHHAYFVFVADAEVFGQLREEITGGAVTVTGDLESVSFGSGDDPLVVYWNVKKGHSTSTAFAKLLTKAKYKAALTTRNLNTLKKMCALAAKSACKK